MLTMSSVFFHDYFWVEQSSSRFQKKSKPLIIYSYVFCLSLLGMHVICNFKIHREETEAKTEPKYDTTTAYVGVDLNCVLYFLS